MKDVKAMFSEAVARIKATQPTAWVHCLRSVHPIVFLEGGDYDEYDDIIIEYHHCMD